MSILSPSFVYPALPLEKGGVGFRHNGTLFDWSILFWGEGIPW